MLFERLEQRIPPSLEERSDELEVALERAAAEELLGRFAVDFVVVQDDSGAWTPYAIELNLRKGGTTHPYLTLQFLTDGEYDADRALFVTPTGKAKFFVSTDRLESKAYRVLQPDDIAGLGRTPPPPPG